jgi:hypothetical protein
MSVSPCLAPVEPAQPKGADVTLGRKFGCDSIVRTLPGNAGTVTFIDYDTHRNFVYPVVQVGDPMEAARKFAEMCQVIRKEYYKDSDSDRWPCDQCTIITDNGPEFAEVWRRCVREVLGDNVEVVFQDQSDALAQCTEGEGPAKKKRATNLGSEGWGGHIDVQNIVDGKRNHSTRRQQTAKEQGADQAKKDARAKSEAETQAKNVFKSMLQDVTDHFDIAAYDTVQDGNCAFDAIANVVWSASPADRAKWKVDVNALDLDVNALDHASLGMRQRCVSDLTQDERDLLANLDGGSDGWAFDPESGRLKANDKLCASFLCRDPKTKMMPYPDNGLLEILARRLNICLIVYRRQPTGVRQHMDHTRFTLLGPSTAQVGVALVLDSVLGHYVGGETFLVLKAVVAEMPRVLYWTQLRRYQGDGTQGEESGVGCVVVAMPHDNRQKLLRAYRALRAKQLRHKEKTERSKQFKKLGRALKVLNSKRTPGTEPQAELNHLHQLAWLSKEYHTLGIRLLRWNKEANTENVNAKYQHNQIVILREVHCEASDGGVGALRYKVWERHDGTKYGLTFTHPGGKCQVRVLGDTSSVWNFGEVKYKVGTLPLTHFVGFGDTTQHNQRIAMGDSPGFLMRGLTVERIQRWICDSTYATIPMIDVQGRKVFREFPEITRALLVRNVEAFRATGEAMRQGGRIVECCTYSKPWHELKAPTSNFFSDPEGAKMDDLLDVSTHVEVKMPNNRIACHFAEFGEPGDMFLVPADTERRFNWAGDITSTADKSSTKLQQDLHGEDSLRVLYVAQLVAEGLQLALLGLAGRSKAQERGMVLSKFISADDECPVNSVAVISGMRKKHVTPAHSHIQPVLNAFLAWEEDIVDLQHPDASAGDPHIPAHVDCCLKAGTYKEWTLQGNKDLPGKSVPRSGSLALARVLTFARCLRYGWSDTGVQGVSGSWRRGLPARFDGPYLQDTQWQR